VQNFNRKTSRQDYTFQETYVSKHVTTEDPNIMGFYTVPTCKKYTFTDVSGHGNAFIFRANATKRHESSQTEL
jgi:hypothetical protein